MAQRPIADDLKRLWNLSVMPTEKVYFAQSYVDRKTGADGKPMCSAIVAMVTNDPSTFSDMHRLPTDEIWHFYLGDPIELLLLHPNGRDGLVVLGHEVLAGQEVQHVVPAGTWMGARLRPGGEYGVYGNTMAPGFVLSDFEGAAAADLICPLAAPRRPDRGAHAMIGCPRQARLLLGLDIGGDQRGSVIVLRQRTRAPVPWADRLDPISPQ